MPDAADYLATNMSQTRSCVVSSKGKFSGALEPVVSGHWRRHEALFGLLAGRFRGLFLSLGKNYDDETLNALFWRLAPPFDTSKMHRSVID